MGSDCTPPRLQNIYENLENLDSTKIRDFSCQKKKKIRNFMGAFWDKLSMDEAKDVIVISFDTVMLEVFGFKSKSSTLVILSQQLNLPIICRGNWLGKQSLVILLVEFILLTHLLVHLSFPVFQCLIQLTQTRSPIHL